MFKGLCVEALRRTLDCCLEQEFRLMWSMVEGRKVAQWCFVDDVGRGPTWVMWKLW